MGIGLVVLHLLLAAGASAYRAADDYATLEAGLERSSLKVNHLLDLVYSIDEQTATELFEKYSADPQREGDEPCRTIASTSAPRAGRTTIGPGPSIPKT